MMHGQENIKLQVCNTVPLYQRASSELNKLRTFINRWVF